MCPGVLYIYTLNLKCLGQRSVDTHTWINLNGTRNTLMYTYRQICMEYLRLPFLLLDTISTVYTT